MTTPVYIAVHQENHEVTPLHGADTVQDALEVATNAVPHMGWYNIVHRESNDIVAETFIS